MRTYLPLLLIWLTATADAADTAGKKQFDMHCKACHALDKSAVGPSLIDIRKNYPASAQKAFISWVNKPGRKRPEGILMPAMAHVGESNIILIHNYILAKAKNAKAKPSRHNFSFKPPAPTYPYVRRGYMPFASPASIGVVLNPMLGLNWDASISRLRYAYIGNKPFFSGERNLQQRQADLLYQETSQQLWSFANGKQPQFKGYRLHNNLPEFIYALGDVTITETISNGQHPLEFKRHFRLDGISQAISMDLSGSGKATISSDKGYLQRSVLHLPAEALSGFTLTVSINK